MDKLKVLFVDGDVQVHQSLRRIIVARRLPIELLLAASADQARRILSARPCDVIVTDAMLPDMDGTQLLTIVRELRPMTMRILLTAEAGEGVVSSLLVAAHQLLNKPVSPAELLDAVQSASRLRFLLMNERLRMVVHRMEHLPVVPKVYTDLTRALRDENTSNQTLARIISQDMSLTTGIIKLVNTPYFGLSRRVGDMLQAVGILGANLIRGLVLADRVFKTLDPDMYPGFDTERLWTHCLDVAKCSRAVMKARGAGGREVEDAFLCGLLHDVGKIVLAEGCPGEYVRILLLSQARNQPLADIEADELCVTHAEVGAYLLGLWGFSEAVVIAIAQHHGVLQGPSLSPLSAVVHVVDVEMHNRYIRSSGYAPHAFAAELLAGGGGEEEVGEWRAVIEAELEGEI
mgnify:CR=1 FL=1